MSFCVRLLPGSESARAAQPPYARPPTASLPTSSAQRRGDARSGRHAGGDGSQQQAKVDLSFGRGTKTWTNASTRPKISEWQTSSAGVAQHTTDIRFQHTHTILLSSAQSTWMEELSARREAGIQARRNARNGVLPAADISADELLRRAKEVAKRAAACRAAERECEIEHEMLVMIFTHVRSCSELKVVARTCRDWRLAASHVRTDLTWQLQCLSVANGLPEPLLLPHTGNRLRKWVAERPEDAVHLLSIKQLRTAGAPLQLVERRLDFDDGLRVPFAVVGFAEATAVMSAIRSRREAEGVSNVHELPFKELLPAACTLECVDPDHAVAATTAVAHLQMSATIDRACDSGAADVSIASGAADSNAAVPTVSVRQWWVCVEGVRLGVLPERFVAAVDVQSRVARLVDCGFAQTANWKVLCLPCESTPPVPCS